MSDGTASTPPPTAPPADAPKKRGRGPGRPMEKGDPRINRSGRPKGVERFRARMEKLGGKGERFAEKVLDAALKLKDDDLSEAAGQLRNTAVKVMATVLEHAWGKPKQTAEITGKDGAELTVGARIEDLVEAFKTLEKKP